VREERVVHRRGRGWVDSKREVVVWREDRRLADFRNSSFEDLRRTPKDCGTAVQGGRQQMTVKGKKFDAKVRPLHVSPSLSMGSDEPV